MCLDFPGEEQQNKNNIKDFVHEERLERCMCVPNNDLLIININIW